MISYHQLWPFPAQIIRMSRPPLSNLIILDDQGFYLFMNICYLAASPHLLHCLSIKVDSKFITLFEAFDLQTFSWCPPCHVNQYFFKRLYPQGAGWAQKGRKKRQCNCWEERLNNSWDSLWKTMLMFFKAYIFWKLLLKILFGFGKAKFPFEVLFEGRAADTELFCGWIIVIFIFLDT